MPSVTRQAEVAFPQVIFVKPRFRVYRAVSRQVRGILAEYTPLIEPLALDEAYLDVTENRKANHLGPRRSPSRSACGEFAARPDPTRFRGRLLQQVPSPRLWRLDAKHASPMGQFVIHARRWVRPYVENLPVGRFHGIGPVTCARMEALGIRNGADLRAQTLSFLQQHFGKAGPYYFALARGIDDRPVCADRIRKSVGAERTFDVDLFTMEEAWVALGPLIAKVWRHCEESTIRGRTVTLKAKFADFHQVTRSRTVDVPPSTQAAIEAIGFELLQSLFPTSKGIRLLGLTLSSLAAEAGGEYQLRLPIY